MSRKITLQDVKEIRDRLQKDNVKKSQNYAEGYYNALIDFFNELRKKLYETS